VARPLRLEFPGAVYHVMARGNDKQAIFLDVADRKRFLAVLATVVERYNLLCHAYCLMGNHYHLLLETPDGNLSITMRHLNGVYGQSFNRRHSKVGHLFQGRYTSVVAEKESYLLEVCRYIVLNPVREGIVAEPGDWEWSSYLAQAGVIETPGFLTVDWILSCFDKIDKTRARRQYRKFVAQGKRPPGSAIEDLLGKPILGSDAFVSRFRGTLSDASSFREIPRSSRFTARPSLRDLFNWVSPPKLV